MIDLFQPWREEEQVFDHNDPMQHHRLLMKRIVAKKTTNQQFLREYFVGVNEFSSLPPKSTEFHLGSFGAPVISRIN